MVGQGTSMPRRSNSCRAIELSATAEQREPRHLLGGAMRRAAGYSGEVDALRDRIAAKRVSTPPDDRVDADAIRPSSSAAPLGASVRDLDARRERARDGTKTATDEM